MHKLLRGEPLAPLFKPGTILWRSVGFSGQLTPQPHKVTFEKTPKGTFLARLVVSGDFLNEPVVIDGNCKGIVVFVDAPIPQDWTHLVVNGVSKPMCKPYNPHQDYTKNKGNAVFASVPIPHNLDDYLNFRQQVAQNCLLNATFQEKVNVASNHWPPHSQHTTCRLVTHYNFSEEILFDFCHLRLRKKEDQGEHS